MSGCVGGGGRGPGARARLVAVPPLFKVKPILRGAVAHIVSVAICSKGFTLHGRVARSTGIPSVNVLPILSLVKATVQYGTPMTKNVNSGFQTEVHEVLL